MTKNLEKELLNILPLTQNELGEYIKNISPYPVIEDKEKCILINPNQRILLASHLDVAGDYPEIIIKTGNKIRSTKNLIGGDDRCGVAIMLQLIKEGVDCYSYAFFYDEEIGCWGSSQTTINFSHYNCFIGLDRRGYNDLATYGHDSEILNEIFIAQGYKLKTGSITDVAILSETFSAPCINLSVGFSNEHTNYEFIELDVVKKTYNVLKNKNLQKELENPEILEDYLENLTNYLYEIYKDSVKYYDMLKEEDYYEYKYYDNFFLDDTYSDLAKHFYNTRQKTRKKIL